MRRKVGYILTLCAVATAFIGLLLWFNLKTDGVLASKTTLKIDSASTKTLTAEIKDIYPGESGEYEINLTGDGASAYIVKLDFKKRGDGTLGKYLTVTISTGSVTVEKSLEELFEGAEVELGANAEKITIKYSMPLDVGNEAQGAKTSFYLDVIASTKKEK